MEIPVIKTLVTYRYKNEKKSILRDYFDLKEAEMYERIDLENHLISDNPFEFNTWDTSFREYAEDTGYYITYWKDRKEIAKVDLFVEYVFEFKGKRFVLQEKIAN